MPFLSKLSIPVCRWTKTRAGKGLGDRGTAQNTIPDRGNATAAGAEAAQVQNPALFLSREYSFPKTQQALSRDYSFPKTNFFQPRAHRRGCPDLEMSLLTAGGIWGL